ncbi:hypothetical protein V1288_003784 [Bradyrhizobium sp. AZCC 2176]
MKRLTNYFGTLPKFPKGLKMAVSLAKLRDANSRRWTAATLTAGIGVCARSKAIGRSESEI